ncbi:MAG: hypothetical protein U0168_13260 [Nannocystaceae bacterium]
MSRVMSGGSPSRPMRDAEFRQLRIAASIAAHVRQEVVGHRAPRHFAEVERFVGVPEDLDRGLEEGHPVSWPAAGGWALDDRGGSSGRLGGPALFRARLSENLPDLGKPW